MTPMNTTLLAAGAFVLGAAAISLWHPVRGGFLDRHAQAGHLCSHSVAAGWLVDYAKRRIEPRPEQEAHWAEFAAAIEEAEPMLADICSSWRESAPAAEKLAAFEDSMESGLDWLRKMRPAFERLYAALDDAQRRRLDGLLEHRRRS